MNRDLHGGRYPQSVVMNMEEEADSNYDGASGDVESANHHQSSMMSDDYPPGRPDHEVKFALNRIIRILKLDRFRLLAEFHKNTDLVFTGVAAIASLIPKSFEKRSKSHSFDANFSEIDYFGHLSTTELERHAIEILQGVINFQQTLTTPIIVELEGKNKIRKHFVEEWIQGVQEKFFKILSLTSSPEIICRLLYLKISTDSADNVDAAKDDLAVYGDFLDALEEIDWQKLIVEFPDCSDKSSKTRAQVLKLLNLPKDFQKVILKLTEAEFDQYIEKKLDINLDKNNKTLLKKKVKNGAKEEQGKESIKLMMHAYNLMISLFYSGYSQQETQCKLVSLSALATIAKMSLNATLNSKTKGQTAVEKSKKPTIDSELKTARDLLKGFFSIDYPHDAIGDLVANATGIIMSRLEKKSGTKKKKTTKTLSPIAKYLIDEVTESLTNFQECYKSHVAKSKEGFPKTVYRFLNANMNILKLYIEKLPAKQRNNTLLAKTKEVFNQYIESIRFEIPANDEVAQLFMDTIECLSSFTVIEQLGSEWAILALNKSFVKLLLNIVDWSKTGEFTSKYTLGLSTQAFFMKLAEELFNLVQRLHKYWKSSFDPAKVAQTLFSEGIEKVIEGSVKIPQLRGRVGVLVADILNKLENSKQKKGKEQFHFTQSQEASLRNIIINILKHFDMRSVHQLIRIERFDSVTFLLSRLSKDEILLYVLRSCDVFANSTMSAIDPISSGNCYLNYLPKYFTAVFPVAEKNGVWHDLLYKLIEKSNKLVDEGQEAMKKELERVNDPSLEEKKVTVSNTLSKKISAGLWFVLSVLSPKSIKKHSKLTKELFMNIFDLIDHQISLLSCVLMYTKKVTKISYLKAERLLQSYDIKVQHAVEYLVSLVKDSGEGHNNPKSIPNITSKDRTIVLNKLVNIYEFFCTLRVELLHLNDLEEVHKLPPRKVKNLFVTSILSLLRSDKEIELSDSLALRVLRSVQPILLKASTKNPIIESVNRALSPLWEEYFQNLTEIVFRLVDKKNLKHINDLLNEYGQGFKESEDYMLSQDWSIDSRSENSSKMIEETPPFTLRSKLGLDLEFYEFLFNKILEYLQNDKPREIIALSSLLVTIRELAAKDPNTKVIFFLFADKITTIFRLLLSECSREHTDHSFFKVILTVKTIILSSINSSIEFRNQPEVFLKLENKYIEIILKMFANVIERYNTYKDGVLDHTIKAYIWNLLCVVKEILLSGEVRRLTLETPNKVFLQSKFTVAKMIIIFLKKSQFNKIFFLRSVYSIAIASIYSLLRTGRKPYNQQVVVKGILDPVNYNFNLNEINFLVYEISENEEENDKNSVFGTGFDEIPKPPQDLLDQHQSIELDKEFLRELPAEIQGALQKDFPKGDMEIVDKVNETDKIVPVGPSSDASNYVNLPNEFLKVLPPQQLSQVLNKIFEETKSEENKFDTNTFLLQLDNATRNEVLNNCSERLIKKLSPELQKTAVKLKYQQMDKIKDPFLTEFLEDPLFHDAKFAESLILITLLCGSRIIYAKYFIAVLKVLFKNEKIFRRYYELGLSCLANETLFYDLLHNSNPYKSDPCQTILNKCSAEDFVETEAILIDAIINGVDNKLCEFLVSNPPKFTCIAEIDDSESVFVQKVKKKIGGYGENNSVLRGWALNLKSKTPLYQINQGKTLNKVIEFLTKLLGLAGEMKDQVLKSKLEEDLQFTLRIILNLVFNVDSVQAARMLHHTILSPIVKKSSSWVSNFVSMAIFDLLNTVKNCFKDYPAEIIENSSRLALYFTYIERVGNTISSLMIYYLSFYESAQAEASPSEKERIKSDAKALLINLFQSEGFGVIINAIQKTKNLFVRVQSFLVLLIHIYIFKNWTFGNQNLEFLKRKGVQAETSELGNKIVQQMSEMVENLIRHAEKNPEYVNILRGLLSREKSPQSNEVSEVIRALTKFETRHQILKLNLDSCHRPGEMRLFVRKDRVLSDSFDIIRNMPGEKLKISLQVNFIQDNNPIPGKFNEWMEILFQQAVDEKYGLFTKLAIPNTYEINSESWVQDNHLNYFEFLGKMLAKALMEKFEMKVLFPVSFYKILFNRQLTLEDLIEVNPQLFEDLYSILKEPIGTKEIYFVSSLNAPVGTKEVLLKPNGRELRVTEENKHEYVKLMLEYTLFGKIKDQMINLKKGFYTLVSEEFFLPFTACELEAVMCRIPCVELEEFKPFIEYEGIDRNSTYIQWLWEVIFQLDNADISNIFYAILGTTKISVETFKQAKMKVRVIKESNQLPTSDIGSRTLTLPLYQSKQELQEKLLLSMRFYEGFVVEPPKMTAF